MALSLGCMPERPIHGTPPICRQPGAQKSDAAPPMDRGLAMTLPPPRFASCTDLPLGRSSVVQEPGKGLPSPTAVGKATASSSVAPCKLQPDPCPSSGLPSMSNSQEYDLSARCSLAAGDDLLGRKHPIAIRSSLCSAQSGAAFSWDDFKEPLLHSEGSACRQTKMSTPRFSERGSHSMPDLGPGVSNSSTSGAEARLVTSIGPALFEPPANVVVGTTLLP